MIVHSPTRLLGLLDNPEVTSAAPWCAALDNLQLAILILTPPWASAAGLRRAELERQLENLDLPLGPLYFQRVKRAVARLEEIGALSASGEGRSRRFIVTPEGFAALLLNLCVLHADPTLDGSEFELKRTLVSLLNGFAEAFAEAPGGEPQLSVRSESFFDAVEELRVLGQPVITEDVEGKALDILRLIVEQRRQVERLLAAARERRVWEETMGKTLDLEKLASSGFGEAALLVAQASAEELARLSPSRFPWFGPGANTMRYEHFLRYLDELASLYTAKLKTVGLESARSFLAARRAG